MKKIIVLCFVMTFFSGLKAQTFIGIDLVKLNKALSEQKITGFTFDSVSAYNGIIGSYKSTGGDEMVIAFDSLKLFKEIPKEMKGKIITFKKNKTNLIFFENDYIMALYIELTDFKITMSLTSSFTSREILEKVYSEINPEELLKKALVK